MKIQFFKIFSVMSLGSTFKKTWHGTIRGFGGRRAPRYFWLACGGLTGIWVLSIAYLTLTPRSYESGFTLILPGAGAGASINLNAIGQASSLSESAFSNTRVSPTESYKRLLMSDRVNDAAKNQASHDTFPRPRIKLLDQTQFMEVSIKSGSPEDAFQYASILNTVFMAEVDKLRHEERIARESGYTSMLGEFEKNVSLARNNLLHHQSQSGLVSIDQYNENVAAVETIHTDLNNSLISLAEARQKRDALTTSLNITAPEAAIALAFAADPVFVSLSSGYAKAEATLAEWRFKFGENHPKRLTVLREKNGIAAELNARGHKTAGVSRKQVMSIAGKLSQGDYTTLLKQIVDADAVFQSLEKKSAALSQTLNRERARVAAQSTQAAKLDDFVRAHQVAEAVFRSSMARIETNKTDLYASYPLIQTVEPPHLPTKPASPIPALGILGAVAASVMYLIGLSLLCLRLPILRALSKTI